MRLAPRLRLIAPLALVVAVSLSSACNLHFGSGVEAQDTWTRTYPVKAGATLDIRGTAGRVRIQAVDSDKIEVKATRVAKAPTEEAAQAVLKDFVIAESATNDSVSLDGTRGMTLSLNRSISVSYEITVPRSTSVTIKVTDGDVDVEGITGRLRVETTNGRIIAAGLGDGADVNSTNGQINLDFAAIGASGVRCKTTNGQIIVTVPSSAKATIAGRVVNGVVHAENLAMQASEQSAHRLDATMGGGGPEIRLEAINGEVRVVGK